MYKNLDYEHLEPLEIMNFLKLKKDTERIKKILDLWIFKAKDWKLTILSDKCTINKKFWNETKNYKNWFPFRHQAFWFTLMDMKDLDYAISEVKRILQWERQYMFPNGTLVSLDK